MSQVDAQRLRNDLTTLRAVVGAELPFEPVDVHYTLRTGIATLLPAAVCLAGVRNPYALLAAAIPFLIALSMWGVRNYRGAHPAKPCPAAKRREYRVGLPIVLLAIPLVPGFAMWASAAGAPADMANGCILIFMGLFLLFAGLYDPLRRSALFVAVPAIVMGLLWPFVGYFTLFALLFLAIGLGMIASAVYMRWQLQAFQNA